jgi:hypothetical protein
VSKNAIYLSGWEYNRLLAEDPVEYRQSALPAQALWDGAAQFWLFEKVYCLKESLDGETAAAADLGWTTGTIFNDLRRRGFLHTVDLPKLVAEDAELGSELRKAWSALRPAYGAPENLLALLQDARDDELEAIKLQLMSPILLRFNCLQNISPNSIRHWIQEGVSGQENRHVEEGMRALIRPIAEERQLLRAHFILCRRPGTGVSQTLKKKQEEVEERIQKPMIPHLLAGILPQEEYHDALRGTASVYAPINEQLLTDYWRNVDRLERLRDIAKQEIWKDLHGDWLPRLDQDPSFLPQFKTMIRDAVLRSKFDPYLKSTTDMAIANAVQPAITGLSGVIASTLTGDAGSIGVATAVGLQVGDWAKRNLDELHKGWRKRSENLTMFYQRVRRTL